MIVCLLWQLSAVTPHAVPVALTTADSVRVTVSGQPGPPVVLLPGLFGSAFAFRQLVPQLEAAGYRVFVMEPPGFGDAPRPRAINYSLTAQAARVARALDTMRVRAAIVVAHAISGSIAYRLAYQRPDLVAGIVSLDGGPAEAAATPGFRRAMKFAPWIKLFGGKRLVRHKITNYLRNSSGDPAWVTDSVIDGYTAGAGRDIDATLRAFIGMAGAREPGPLQPHLAEIRCPVVLVLGGVRHPGAPPAAEVAELQQRLRVFAIDSLPGVGPFAYEERPAAVVAAVDRVRRTAPAP
jgi:pimeloyl-ACP methyl ester carboxylesterase